MVLFIVVFILEPETKDAVDTDHSVYIRSVYQLGDWPVNLNLEMISAFWGPKQAVRDQGSRSWDALERMMSIIMSAICLHIVTRD